ncbi:MAG: hypothetical protein HXY49_11090 [Ignavibacteriaceae bacterium]|nr:hypothetical protein [Ignavibacteriaceae bacterium]
MFITFLLITFLVALITCILVIKIFDNPIEKILSRIITDEISKAWHKYIKFAVFVVGISGGVEIWQLERFITPQAGPPSTPLTAEYWILEIYRTILGTLQSIAWILLLFFLFALIAYVIVRVLELKRVLPGKEEIKNGV